MPAVRFEVLARDSTTAARAGLLHTPHGLVPTPAFAPVATQGTVKAVAPRQLGELGAVLLMTNAYHLAMRPGAATVAALGGIHALASWDGAIMADSGGYQVLSLGALVRHDEAGVTFRYPPDGSVQHFSPEGVMAVQEALGADIALPLDVPTPYPASADQAARDVAVTVRWAERSQAARRRADQAVFGIVQGATDLVLRREAAHAIAALGFEGFAIGGLSVGEPKAVMLETVAVTAAELPDERPRHLLGVGHPDDLVFCVAQGIDSFDCVMPTRVARNGAALAADGRMNLRNARYANDRRPLVEGCSCYACRHFSRGAIRHWLLAGEILALHLLTVHNLHFTLRLMRQVREAILTGTFRQLQDEFASAQHHLADASPVAHGEGNDAAPGE